MPVGNSTWNVQSGGGVVRASSSQLARTVVHLGVSPLAPTNTLIPLGAVGSQILAALGQCPLAELCAFTAREGQPKYALILNASLPGAIGTVVQSGTGTGTLTVSAGPLLPILVRCVTGGTLGTATFQYSLDGGVTWSAIITSTVSSFTMNVLFTVLTFSAATYVATKTLTIGTNGVVTPGSAWVGTVTQASSPADDFELVVTMLKGGALGIASIQVSLDNGNAVEIGSLLTPSGGVVVIPNSGLVLTFSDTFNQNDSYSCLTARPGYTATDVSNALTALKAISTVQATLIHLEGMPSSAATAFSVAATLYSQISDAFSNAGFDWQGISDCPSPQGGTRISSALNSRKLQRGASWLWVDRYMDTDPKTELAAKAPKDDAPQGPFRAFLPAGTQSLVGLGDIIVSGGAAVRDSADTDTVIRGARGSDLNRVGVCVSGRDEQKNPGLDDAQINTFRSYNGPLAVYGTVSAGTAGFKMLSTDSSFIDGAGVRVLDVLIAGMRPLADNEIGSDYETNADGTISASAKSQLDSKFNTNAQLILGMQPGGQFTNPQASFVSAEVLASSQLGQSPKRLDFAYQLETRGKVTATSNDVQFSGVISVTQ